MIHGNKKNTFFFKFQELLAKYVEVPNVFSYW